MVRCLPASLLVFVVLGVHPASAPAAAEEQAEEQLVRPVKGFVLVTGSDAKVQSGTNILGVAPRGIRLPYSQQQGAWYKVRLPESSKTIEGWINGQFVQIESPPAKNLAADEREELLAAAASLRKQAGELEKQPQQVKQRIALYRRAVELYLRAVGRSHEDTANAIDELAEALYDDGQMAESCLLYEQVVTIRRDLLGLMHQETARAIKNLAVLWSFMGEDNKSASLRRQAIEIARKVLGEDHPDTLNYENGLAYVEMYRKNFRQAIEIFNSVLARRLKALGPGHADVGNTLSALGACYRELYEYEKARDYYQRALIAYLKSTGESDDTLAVRTLLGNTLWHLGKRDEAMQQYDRALEVMRQNHGPDSDQVALTIRNMALSMSDTGDYAEAVKHMEQAMQIARRVHGEQDAETADYLYHLGKLYEDLARFQEGQKCFEECLRIRLQVYGAEHPSVAETLKQYGEILATLGKLNESMQVLQRALAIAIKLHGKQSEAAADCYRRIADVLRVQGRFGEAEQHYRFTLEISRKIYGDRHPHVAAALYNLSSVYVSTGKYQAARDVLLQALAIYDAIGAPVTTDLASIHNGLGLAYKLLGELKLSQQHLQRSLELSRQLHSDAHDATASTLLNLGVTLELQGEFAAAAEHYEQSRKIFKQVVGEESAKSVSAMIHLGSIYTKMQRPDDALAMYQQALQICGRKPEDYPREMIRIYDGLGRVHQDGRQYFEKALELCIRLLGEDHPDVGALRHSLAFETAVAGDLPQAKRMYEAALAHRERAEGKDSIAAAETLSALASVSYFLGEDDAALKYVDRAMSISESRVGPHDPSLINGLRLKGNLFVRQGRIKEAANLFDLAHHRQAEHVTRVLPGMTEGEQTSFLTRRAAALLHNSLTLALSSQDNHLAELSASWLMNSKGRIQETLAQRVQLARSEGNPQAAEVAEQLQSVRTQLARLALANVGPAQRAARDATLAKLESQEAELSRTLGRLGLNVSSATKWVSLEEVRSKIPTDSVFVDFCYLPVLDLNNFGVTSRHYAAWVIPAAGQGDVHLVDLGTADSIEALIQPVLASLAQAPQEIRDHGEVEATAETRKHLAALSKQVLSPLEPYFGQSTELLLCPDHALWLVPWSALSLADDRYVVEKYRLREFISGRDLVTQRSTAAEHTPPVIMAHPAYDKGAESGTQRSTDTQRGRFQFPALPGTAAEARAIAGSIEKFAGAAPQTYLQEEARESVLKAISRPRTLTLCTHGFFLPSEATGEEETSGVRNFASSSARTSAVENPLLRCGLAFASANRQNVPEGEEDGILTGLEIAGLDLRGTELVVLSACETAVGELRSGEGVAGLRQAFQLAGADSVVATLWQVADLQTARLMSDFFKHLAAGKTQGDALRQAQLDMIRSRTARSGAAHPFFWAAFTLTGRGTE